MAQRDKVGVVVTPSRRTDPAVTEMIRTALAPSGGWVWNFVGENPYFGMLALADLILVTQDSVSMISEAAATTAPVFVAQLPGSWRRQGLFLKPLMDQDRIRPFHGRFCHMEGVALERYTSCRGRDAPPSGALEYDRWPNVAGEPVRSARTPSKDCYAAHSDLRRQGRR